MVSLSGEYQELRDVGAEFITHAQWGARFDYSNERTVVEPAKQIFIHITVTNPNNYQSHAAHVRAIEAIGISRFGATGISYNRIILFGVNKPYIGQRISRRGAHTVNDHRRSTCNRWGAACPGNGGDLTAPSWNNNYTARSYAYGALTQHSVTDSVLDTFAKAIAADIKAGFVRRDAKIHGHRCLSSKSCPGDHMWARMHELEKRVNHYLSNGLNGDSMSWNETLEPTSTAAKRFPDGYTRRAGKVLMHVLGLAYQSTYGKISPNSWMKARWPDMPDKGYSPRVYLRSGYGHSRAAKEEAVANGKQLGKLAGEVAGLRNAVEQLAANAGHPVDMAAVEAAALAGAQAAMAELSITVTVEPAEEPDGSEPDPADATDA